MKHIIITGHYGSGKTNLAVNLAIELSEKERVTLIDADIVNPCFRSADNRELLEKHGISCIIPVFANTNLDVPALPADIQRVFGKKDGVTVWDIGGDDDGAVVLGCYADQIKKDGYEFLYVVNFYRPLTVSEEEVAELLYSIQNVSKLEATGIVNNSNLGEESDRSTLPLTYEKAESLSQKLGLGIVYSTVSTALYNNEKNVVPIDMITKKYW